MTRPFLRLAFLIPAVAILFAAAGFAHSTDADLANGLERVDAYGVDLVAYATVNRTDGTYRRMLTEPAAVEAIRDRAELPDRTRILMETYYRPGVVGAVFHMQKINGRWEYGSFGGSRSPDLSVGPRASCLACHARAAETDLVFTLPSMRAAGLFAAEDMFTCDRGGRRPCNDGLYLRRDEQ